MKNMILAAITLYAMTTNAQTDWACFRDCRAAGYSYGYCMAQCDY